MAGNIKVEVCDSAEAVAVMAAGKFADLVKSQPDAVIGLATGSTPEQTYAELVVKHREDGLGFAGVTAFNLDEYWGLGGDHDHAASQVIVPMLLLYFPYQLGRLPSAKPRAVFPGVRDRGRGGLVKKRIGVIEGIQVLTVAVHCRIILCQSWPLRTGSSSSGLMDELNSAHFVQHMRIGWRESPGGLAVG